MRVGGGPRGAATVFRKGDCWPATTAPVSPQTSAHGAAGQPESGAAQERTAGFEQGWIAKGPRRLERRAPVLHVMGQARRPGMPLSDHTLRQAMRLHDSFHLHLRLLLPRIEGSLTSRDQQISAALTAAGPARLTRDHLRDALDHNVSSADMQQTLDHLAELSRIKPHPRASLTPPFDCSTIFSLMKR
jgi:hypothetical protein